MLLEEDPNNMTQVAVAPGHLIRTLLPLVTALPLQPQQDGNQTVPMKSGECTQHSNENIQFRVFFYEFSIFKSHLLFGYGGTVVEF